MKILILILSAVVGQAQILTPILTGLNVSSSGPVPTLISQGCAGSASGTSTAGTLTLNTTGADFIHIDTADYMHDSSTDIVSDSLNGATYSHLTNQQEMSFGLNQAQWYIANPMVGAVQVFTISGNYVGFCVKAFSNMATTSVYDTPHENGAVTTTTVTSLQPGAITASQNGNLLITAETGESDNTDTYTINLSFVYTDTPGLDSTPFVGGVHVGLQSAYLVQGAAVSTNPLWQGMASTSRAATIASFKHQ